MPKRRFDEAIEVKNPCSESWEEMVGNDQVRLCSHCAKDVNDISTMTRRDAMRLVRRSKGGLCVRYQLHPIKRTPAFATRVSSIALQTGIAAGVITASIAMADAVYAQGGVRRFDTVRAEQSEKTGVAVSSSISGYVSDQDGAVIPFAVVSLSNLGTYEYKAVNASEQGFYEFKELSAGSYTIKIEAGGFEAKQVVNVQLGEASDVRRDARLEVQQVAATVEVKDAAETEHWVTVGLLVSNEVEIERNALVAAVLDENIDLVKELIMNGARLNARDKSLEGMTPLHAAIETGNMEIMQFLLAYGAKPNARDLAKRTPLMMLDEDAEEEMVRILLSYGANIKLADAEKNTVLHHFAEFDEPKMLRFLIQHGADPNARNKARKTPLMIAAENDNAEAVRALLESGADMRAMTKKRQTALDLAGSEKIRELLLTFGAFSSLP